MLALLATGPLCAALLALQGPRLEGVVRASSGAAAAGARVALSFPGEWPGEPARLVDETVADAEGRFALAISDEWMRERDWKTLDVWAWSEGRGLAAVSLGVAEAPIGQELALVLPGAKDHEFTILDPDGTPVAGALVRPSTFGGRHVPELVAEALATLTGARGIATVAFDPQRTGSLLVEAGAYGRQIFVAPFPANGWSGSEPPRLFPVGQVRIEIEGEPPAGLPEGRLELTTYNRVDPEDDRSGQVGGKVVLPLSSLASGTTTPLVHGYTNLHLRFAATPPRVPRLFPARVEPGETATVRILWGQDLPVTGRVEDRDGRPVAGAEVRVLAYPLRFTVTSDAEGRLAFRATPGPLMIERARAEGWFAGLSAFAPLRCDIPADAASFELPPLRLVKSSPVRGRVVDEEGRPVAGAWVHGVQQARLDRGRILTIPSCALADAEGRFELGGLDPEAPLELGARHGTRATTEPLQVAVASPDPVVIVLAASDRLPVAGTVRDRAGRPVPGATVVFWRESPENVIGGEREEKLAGGRMELTSDDEGRVQAPPSLSRGKRYCAIVRAGGFAPLESEWFTAEEASAGLVFELEPLTTLAGRLLDREGGPIAGARVLVRGDAPRAVEATTDRDGRFTLSGVFARGFLIAEAGHGSSARRFDGDAPLEWRLGSPSPAGRESALTRERELELARELLAADVEAEREDEDALLRALQRLAWADPAGTLAALAEQPLATGWKNEFVRAEVVEVLCGRDPEEALALADSLEDPWRSALAALHVADALGPEQRARELELLGMVRARARRIEYPPYRLVTLAHVAERLLDLGERDEARALLDEGLLLAKTLPSEDWAGYARASFAEELAQVDLEPALELVSTIGEEDRGRHLGNIAHELAPIDPEAAERVLASLPPRGSWPAAMYAPRVCYRMAAADLGRARRLAAASVNAGECYGALALALAEKDAETARELLRRAFEVLERPAPRIRHASLRVAASLLPLVARLVPGEHDSWVARVLALREPRADLARPGALARYLQADAEVAFYLAQADRELARSLLEPAVSYLLENGDGRRSSEWRGVCAALAQADPARAAELAGNGLPPSARAAVGSVLARAGDERVRFVQDEVLGLWVADEEGP